MFTGHNLQKILTNIVHSEMCQIFKKSLDLQKTESICKYDEKIKYSNKKLDYEEIHYLF